MEFDPDAAMLLHTLLLTKGSTRKPACLSAGLDQPCRCKSYFHHERFVGWSSFDLETNRTSPPLPLVPRPADDSARNGE